MKKKSKEVDFRYQQELETKAHDLKLFKHLHESLAVVIPNPVDLSYRIHHFFTEYQKEVWRPPQRARINWLKSALAVRDLAIFTSCLNTPSKVYPWPWEMKDNMHFPEDIVRETWFTATWWAAVYNRSYLDGLLAAHFPMPYASSRDQRHHKPWVESVPYNHRHTKVHQSRLISVLDVILDTVKKAPTIARRTWEGQDDFYRQLTIPTEPERELELATSAFSMAQMDMVPLPTTIKMFTSRWKSKYLPHIAYSVLDDPCHPQRPEKVQLALKSLAKSRPGLLTSKEFRTKCWNVLLEASHTERFYLKAAQTLLANQVLPDSAVGLKLLTANLGGIHFKKEDSRYRAQELNDEECWQINLKILKMLAKNKIIDLSEGITIEGKVQYPLRMALSKSTNTVKTFLKYGADANSSSALLWGLDNTNLPITTIEALIPLTKIFECPVLGSAIEHVLRRFGFEGMPLVRKLLAAGANIQAPKNWSPLHTLVLAVGEKADELTDTDQKNKIWQQLDTCLAELYAAGGKQPSRKERIDWPSSFMHYLSERRKQQKELKVEVAPVMTSDIELA